MLIHHWLEAAAAARPDAVALIEATRETSYADLDSRASRVSAALLSQGVVKGDRVVVALDNGLDLVASYFGVIKAGAVAVPLPAGPRSDRLAPAIQDCLPRAAIIDAATADDPSARTALAPVGAVFVATDRARSPLPPDWRMLHEARDAASDRFVAAATHEDDLAAIVYTSGSTGEPRGVMLSHRNFVANATSIIGYLGLTVDDRVMCVLPFYYVYGLSLLHTHVAVGGSLVIENRSAFPNVVLASMEKHGVTGFAGVPSTFTLMLQRSSLAQTALPTLRYVTQAGGGMAPARILEWLEHGPAADFYVMYGATEASARLTYLPPRDLRSKLGSIGRPIPGVDIVVMDEDGRCVTQGAVGELVARGPNISRGYWNNADETARRFSANGYHTGDLGYVDEDGFLFLVGRKHDMIKVGANRVGAKEIEDVLHEHAAVQEAAVVGTAHDLLGEAPIAFVTLREPLEDVANTLRRFCASRLAVYKVPVRVIEIPELPRLAGSGKVDRPTLRIWASEMRFEVTP